VKLLEFLYGMGLIWDSQFSRSQHDLVIQLRGDDLTHTKLTNGMLRYANLESAHLGQADLSYTDLVHTNLTGADMFEVNLTGASLVDADLINANLGDANLLHAPLTPRQVSQVGSLQGATMPDGSRHP
jgi:uncharacterized protein YjbI with pentapeptide repeats